MTKEEKKIVLEDLSLRYVFGDAKVMVEHLLYDNDGNPLSATKESPQKLGIEHIKFLKGDIDDSNKDFVSIKPILRKFDTITTEEIIELFDLGNVTDLHWEILFGDRFIIGYKRRGIDLKNTVLFKSIPSLKNVEWLAEKNFDYMDLIGKDLAYADKHYFF